MYEDIARFNYGGVGAVATPMVMGASNPAGTYLQAAAPAMSGSGVSGGSPLGSTMGLDFFPAAPSPYGGSHPGSMIGGGGGLGMNLDTLQLALGGLQTIGSIWQAWEANKLAKEQFKFAKDFANTNLANQIQSYNTTLEDRTRARTFTEGGTDAEAQAYIDRHSLRKRV